MILIMNEMFERTKIRVKQIQMDDSTFRLASLFKRYFNEKQPTNEYDGFRLLLRHQKDRMEYKSNGLAGANKFIFDYMNVMSQLFPYERRYCIPTLIEK